MKCSMVASHAMHGLLMGSALLFAMTPAFGQVSPVEILNPRLKANEAKYLPQLQALQQSIAAAQFPFAFRLARYANAKPGQRKAADSNGIEFVYFEGREILKVSGIYSAAFNVEQLSKNQRASHAFQDVVAPLLRLVAQQIPADIDCDGIGFEIVYDARDANKAYDYEGREVLTAVFDLKDAFAYANASEDAEWQEILNRTDIFVDGNPFGLALGQPDPLNVQALERSVPRRTPDRSSPRPASAGTVPAAVVSGAAASPSALDAQPKSASMPTPTSGDAMRLQAQFQAQLDAIMKNDGAKFHLAASVPPSFEMQGDRMLLHFTLQDPQPFEKGTTSIYKRAAQSFDLFLAPELKGLLRELPANAGYDALDFSVLNRMGTENNYSETIDYICPLNSVRALVESKITSQDLVNQSIVLVNGVRISMNMQLVE